MRDYGKITGRFWTGQTGKALRGDTVAQVVAAYLLSAQSSNMIGLYYLPLPTLCHETGVTSEGALKALQRLSEVEFAHYDHNEEVVWVVNMAREQVGEALAPTDNQCKGVAKQWNEYRKCSQYMDFYRHYGAAFHLPEPKPLQRPSEAPSKALRSQEQEQEQEKDQEEEKETLAPPSAGAVGGEGTSKAKKAARTSRVKKTVDVPPMPFTIEALLAILAETSKGWFVVEPFDRALAKPLTSVIRSLGESGCTLDDVRLAGEYAAVLVPTWPSAEPLGLNWIATGGKLSTMVGKARSWRDRGRVLKLRSPSPGRTAGPPPPGSNAATVQARVQAEDADRRRREAAEDAALAAAQQTNTAGGTP